MTDETIVQQDWQQRAHERSEAIEEPYALPAPSEVDVAPGTGHIRLDWDPVPGAAGYVIERTDKYGELTVLRHGGADVRAVAPTSFAVTAIENGVDYQFRVAAITGPDQLTRSWSEPVTGRALEVAGGEIVLTLDIDASTVTGHLDRVWKMVGSERLSQLDLGVDEHGHDIGTEFLEALKLAHDDLGVSLVRAHAILHDDLGVARRTGSGQLVFDFARVDTVYDRLLGLGLRPVVELSFMPAALARDPEATVFTYRAIVSPPTAWAEWHDLVHALASHLVERYGVDEVATWAFEVWNEPNLGVFWTGTREEYFRLYDEAARAVKRVGQRLRVGGPSSAACEWVEALVAHARANNVPLDFVSTHTYGNQPLDLRPALARHGFEGTPIWWTEWGTGSVHFGAVHDSVMGAPFMLDGYASAQGRLDALSHWVISDHFEELGRPPRLFHNGFGLLTVGNLRKPRYWALHLAAHQGDERLAAALHGDGADVLIQTSATRHDDGTIEVLVWNGTINTELMGGDPRLDRTVRLTVSGLSDVCYQVHLARVDEHHSNILAAMAPEVEWPDQAMWDRLRARDVLDEERLAGTRPEGGVACFVFEVPMPGVARLRLRAE